MVKTVCRVTKKIESAAYCLRLHIAWWSLSKKRCHTWQTAGSSVYKAQGWWPVHSWFKVKQSIWCSKLNLRNFSLAFDFYVIRNHFRSSRILRAILKHIFYFIDSPLHRASNRLCQIRNPSQCLCVSLRSQLMVDRACKKIFLLPPPLPTYVCNGTTTT